METLPSVFVLVGAVTIATITFFIAQKVTKPIDLDEHQSFLDAMLNIVGTLVSILLGLLVAAALDHYQDLEQNIDAEASNVFQLCRLSTGLPPESCIRIRKLALQYCNEVVKDEWPAMAEGKSSDKVSLTLIKITNEVVRFRPSNDGETNLHNAMLEAMQQVSDARRLRLLVLKSTWAKHLMPILLMCAFIVLVFAFLYMRRGAKLHGFLICFVALALGGNIGLVYVLSNPFSSDWKIEPRGFEMNQEIVREIQANPELIKLIAPNEATPQPGGGELGPNSKAGPNPIGAYPSKPDLPNLPKQPNLPKLPDKPKAELPAAGRGKSNMPDKAPLPPGPPPPPFADKLGAPGAGDR